MFHFAGFFSWQQILQFFSRRCFTPEVHTRTDEHATQFYTSAPLNSTSNLCHCKNFGIASLAKLSRCTGCFHSSMLSTFAQVLFFQFYTLHSFAHVPIVLQIPPNRLRWQPFWGCCLQNATRIFRRLNRSSSQLSRGDTRAPSDGTPSSNPRSTTRSSFFFLAIAWLRN